MSQSLPSPLFSGATGAAPTKRATRSTIKLQPDTAQLRGLFAAFKRLDKEANDELRNDVSAISAWSAKEIKQAAFGYGVKMGGGMPSKRTSKSSQAARVAETVRANRDRIPNVTIGGSKLKFSGGAVSGMVVMGNEWGSGNKFPNGGSRFPDNLYPTGNWIFPTLRDIQPEVTHKWKAAVDKILNNWSKG